MIQQLNEIQFWVTRHWMKFTCNYWEWGTNRTLDTPLTITLENSIFLGINFILFHALLAFIDATNRKSFFAVSYTQNFKEFLVKKKLI